MVVGVSTPGFLSVTVTILHSRDRDEVKIAIADTTPGNETIGERSQSGHRTAQHAGFQAVIMVEMDVQRGHPEIVMVVLCAGQTRGEIALLVIVDVGQDADALRLGIFFDSLAGQESAQQIAHRFGTTRVAEALTVAFEGLRQLGIQGNGESFGHPQ